MLPYHDRKRKLKSSLQVAPFSEQALPNDVSACPSKALPELRRSSPGLILQANAAAGPCTSALVFRSISPAAPLGGVSFSNRLRKA